MAFIRKSDGMRIFPFRCSCIQKLSEMDILLMPYVAPITVSGDVSDITSYTSPLKLFGLPFPSYLILLYPRESICACLSLIASKSK